MSEAIEVIYHKCRNVRFSGLGTKHHKCATRTKRDIILEIVEICHGATLEEVMEKMKSCDGAIDPDGGSKMLHEYDVMCLIEKMKEDTSHE